MKEFRRCSCALLLCLFPETMATEALETSMTLLVGFSFFPSFIRYGVMKVFEVFIVVPLFLTFKFVV